MRDGGFGVSAARAVVSALEFQSFFPLQGWGRGVSFF